MKRLFTLLILMVFLSGTHFGQINYFTSFDGCSSSPCAGWQITGGYLPSITSTSGSGYSPCNTASAKSNLYSSSTSLTTLLSVNALGTSSGAPATLTFIAKAINYTTGAATPAGYATFSAAWGNSFNGPWNTIGSFPNLSSSTCQTYSFPTFNPPAGQSIFIRIQAQRGSSGDFWVVFDDITLTQIAEECSGTPDPGNTIASANPVCPGVSFTLSLENPTSGAGVTYQWQQSPTGGEPWTDVGTSNPTFTTSQTEETYYQCQVSCGENTGTSDPIQVEMASWFYCYCPSASLGSTYEYIGQVDITGGVSNPSGNTPYSDFSDQVANVVQSAMTVVTITKGTTTWYNSDIAYVFIDYNQDGDFDDAGEMVGTANGSQSPYIISFTIPSSAAEGTTRLRIKFGDGGTGTIMNDNPCQVGFTYGEVEDYAVNVIIPTSGLEGFVNDYYGNPIESATVELVNGPSVLSEADGHYLIYPISSGLQEFRCSKMGYIQQTAMVDIPFNATGNQDFTLLAPQMAIYPASLFAILKPSESASFDLEIINDGSGQLSWQVTEEGEGTICDYQIQLYDHYGDGWNGGTLDVFVNGDLVLDDVTLLTGEGPSPYFFEAATDDEITTVFSAGSWPYECWYLIYDNLDNQVWKSDGFDNSVPPPDIMTGQLIANCNGLGDISWLSEVPASGEVDPFGETGTVTVTLDATATPQTRAPGETYHASIKFNPSSGIEPVNIPVTLIVTDGGLKGPEELTPFIIDPVAGEFMLKWKYFTLRDMVFDRFEIYSNGELVGTSPVSSFELQLSEPSVYCYKVYAVYEGDVYSDPSNQACITYPIPQGVPLSGWALAIGALLIVAFTIYMIRRRS